MKLTGIALVFILFVTTITLVIHDAPGRAREKRAHAARLTGGNYDAGMSKIEQSGCGACHVIPGIPRADSPAAAPLDRMARRAYIAGVIENSPENLVRWLMNPPAIDHRTAMPTLHLTEQDARDIACYLYTLD